MSGLPRLRRTLTIQPYGHDAFGRQNFVAEADGHACLVGEDAARVLALLAQHSNLESHNELWNLLPVDTQSRVSSEALVEFLRGSIPAALTATGPNAIRIAPFSFRLRILPADLVNVLAKRLVWLFAPRAFVLTSAMATISMVYGVLTIIGNSSAGIRNAPFLPITLVILSALCHELGHASACVARGVRPGEVGIGVYFVFPVLYTDVSASWALSRSDRLIVSSAGFYFQILFVAMLPAFSPGLLSASALKWVLLVNSVALLHMLNPVFKMDGYWLLSDGMRIPNLHARLRRAILSTFRVSDAELGTPRGQDSQRDLYSLTNGQKILLGAYGGVSIVYLTYLLLKLSASTGAAILRCRETISQIIGIWSAIGTASTTSALFARLAEMFVLVGYPVLLLVAWGVFLNWSFSIFKPRRGIEPHQNLVAPSEV